MLCKYRFGKCGKGIYINRKSKILLLIWIAETDKKKKSKETTCKNINDPINLSKNTAHVKCSLRYYRVYTTQL